MALSYHCLLVVYLMWNNLDFVNFHHRLKHAKKTERGHKEMENINPTFLLNKSTHLNLMQVLTGFHRSHQDS